MTREQDTNSGRRDSAAPASQPASSAAPSLSAAPKQVVVNNGFDNLFLILGISFIVACLSLVALFVIIALLPERRGSVPDFVKYVAGDQYEVVERKLGPMDDNLFRSTTAYVLVRTDADVVSCIEHMNVPDFKFIPLDSPELEIDRKYHQVYDSTEIDKVYRELAGTPPGADCRYFVTRDDPDYSTTYLCFSPESKLLLVFRDWKRWGVKDEND